MEYSSTVKKLSFAALIAVASLNTSAKAEEANPLANLSVSQNDQNSNELIDIENSIELECSFTEVER